MLDSSRLVVLIVCLAAAPLYAQTASNSRGAFVDLPVGSDWDDAYSESTRVRGATLESGFAFGFDSRRSGVEFDVGVPRWHVKNHAPHRFQYVGRSSGYEQQGHFYESSSTVRRRSIDVTVLHRANIPINGHATFTWLVGGGFVYRPEQFTSVTKEVLPDGQLSEVDTSKGTTLRNYLAAAARFDVELRVTPRLSVVPRLRVTAFPSLIDDSGLAPRMFVARPEFAARWRF
jgi:hypothetical protein